ncbi:MAG TPA: DsbA family protein, partial [Rhodobacteraceae bacterium]|nr:DsbA family protein [Paracoccaceae bacterium]
MRKPFLPALGLAFALFAAPVAATDITAMNAEETEAFGAAVRAYLLENPEVLMEAIAVLEQRQAQAQVADDASLIRTNAKDIFDDGYSVVMGNPDGDVTMVEFLDYRCGFCKRAFPEVQELLASDGNIRFVVKEFPILGDDSVLASQFAISTQILFGDEAYTKVHDELMTMRASVSEASLLAVAERLGLDGQAIMDGIDNPIINQVIGANHALAQRLKITGTPGFVVGEQMMRGYVPLENMRQIVAEVRAQ